MVKKDEYNISLLHCLLREGMSINDVTVEGGGVPTFVTICDVAICDGGAPWERIIFSSKICGVIYWRPLSNVQTFHTAFTEAISKCFSFNGYRGC